MLKAIILHLLLIKCVISSTDENQRWYCNRQNRCVVLKEEPELNSGTISYDTQNICRLSCGRYGSLWPRPTGATLISNGRLNFDPNNVRFDINNIFGPARKFFNELNFLFVDNIMKECNNNCTLPASTHLLVRVSVNSTRISLTWDTDESYSFIITPSDSLILIKITAATIFGARHALESVSQLITGSGANGSGLVIVSSARVKDRPVFRHRGLLLDTARNFIPLQNIEKTLDAMASCKLNVFHWHATDSQSFPLEITKVPEMHRFGAYSPQNVYSNEEIRYIIQYAKHRGIRTILELDAPSHSGNGWQWGPQAELGNLAVCVNQQPWREFCIQPPCGQLNPVNKNVYSVLRDIYEEFAEILPNEEVLHMGGDEVFFGCWNSSEEILQGMRNRGLDTNQAGFLRLWAEFQAKNLAAWDDVKGRNHNSNYNSMQTSVILWTSHLTDPEVIDQFLSPERYIIQTWVEASNPLTSQLLSKGYKIIASTKDAWYLDHGFWGKTDYYGWKKVYQNRLQKSPLMLGGEVCMWTEYVDENSLDTRVWPRAGAAAERLWADPETDANLAEARFYRFRERLLSRGINPDAITPKWCTQNEGECL